MDRYKIPGENLGKNEYISFELFELGVLIYPLKVR